MAPSSLCLTIAIFMALFFQAARHGCPCLLVSVFGPGVFIVAKARQFKGGQK
jgi:hypothetical protein